MATNNRNKEKPPYWYRVEEGQWVEFFEEEEKEERRKGSLLVRVIWFFSNFRKVLREWAYTVTGAVLISIGIYVLLLIIALLFIHLRT